jgi:hypothetical protein
MIIAQIRACYAAAGVRVRVSGSLSFLPHSQADRYFRRTKHWLGHPGWRPNPHEPPLAKIHTYVDHTQRPYVVFTVARLYSILRHRCQTSSPEPRRKCRALGTQPLSSLHHHAHFICLWIFFVSNASSASPDTQSPTSWHHVPPWAHRIPFYCCSMISGATHSDLLAGAPATPTSCH